MSRLRDDRGMTLMEMLVAMVIGLLVCLAVFGLVDFTMRRSGDIGGRVSANQRGRVAMDLITQQLRSQVCLPSGTPPMFSRTGNLTDDANATFFVDLTSDPDPTVAPQLHTIAYDNVAHSIMERDYSDKLPADVTLDPAYAGTPTTRTLLSDVAAVNGVPVFTYYRFDGTPVATPVAAADLGDIASVRITFRSLPTRFDPANPAPRGSVVFQNRVTVREVDPNVSDPQPECD
jgi:prepilin-type N-terminal cleavage/methylation domain-containing protein